MFTHCEFDKRARLHRQLRSLAAAVRRALARRKRTPGARVESWITASHRIAPLPDEKSDAYRR